MHDKLAALAVTLCLPWCAAGAAESFLVTGELDREAEELRSCEDGKRYRLLLPSSVSHYIADQALRRGISPMDPLVASLEVSRVRTPEQERPTLAATELVELRAGRCEDGSGDGRPDPAGRPLPGAG